MEKYDLIIIGGSAAASAAGIYAIRRNLNFKIISKDFGGEVATSGEIDNYPGVPDTNGIELTEKLRKHLADYGVEPEIGIEVEKVSRQDDGTFCITAKTDGSLMAGDKMPAPHSSEGAQKCDYIAKTVLIATGVHPRELNVPGEKELRNKGVSYCTVCLPPKSMVVANNELKAIETFKIGDKVLTDDGTYQQVLKIMERPYNGDLIKIKSRFFLEEKVKLTPNHPVLTTTLKKGNGKYYRNFEWGEYSWVPAGELTENHILVYPIVKETEDVSRLLISEIINFPTRDGFVKNRRETYTSRRIKDELNLEDDFFRLAGYYLAEGSRNGYTTAFYFSKKEKDYIDDTVRLIKKYFEILPNVKITGPVTRISVYSMIFSELFDKLFGHFSYGKRLPHWVTILPVEKQKELIKGLWRGDGGKVKKSFVLVTNSCILAGQVKNILLRLGIIPRVTKIGLAKLRKRQGRIGNRIIHFRHAKYEITVGGPFLDLMSEILGQRHPRIDSRKRITRHAYLKDGYCLLPIKKIGREFYKGNVYNLVVEKNHSYVTTNSAVHNCDGPLFPGKTVAIIGGGNSALEAGIMMADIAIHVYMVNKNPVFKGDQVLIDNLLSKKNVEVIYNVKTTQILGDGFVSSLKYKDQNGQEQQLKVDGVFIHIGMVPNSKVVSDEVEKNQFGEIVVSKNCETNIPGLFAAGDVTDVPFKQISIAVGQGTCALLSAVQYLNRLQQSKS